MDFTVSFKLIFVGHILLQVTSNALNKITMKSVGKNKFLMERKNETVNHMMEFNEDGSMAVVKSTRVGDKGEKYLIETFDDFQSTHYPPSKLSTTKRSATLLESTVMSTITSGVTKPASQKKPRKARKERRKNAKQISKNITDAKGL